jgi:hypothetical protein
MPLNPLASHGQSPPSQLSGKDSPRQREDVYRTCGLCDLGFDSLSKLEVHANEANHLSFACGECSARFGTVCEFEAHQLNTGHAAFACTLDKRWSPSGKCNECYHSWSMLAQHQNDPQFWRHLKRSNLCAQCGALFRTDAGLTRHAVKEIHGAHQCSVEGCNSSFTREADRLRHEIQHSTDEHPKYPCPHCHRHRGVKGFKREDHLTQHLRNYHNIEPERGHFGMVYACSHSGCPEHREGGWTYRAVDDDGYPFKTLAERTKHLKEVHDESKFPCPVPFCDKVGGQGYVRKGDLVKHIKAKHPKAPSNPQLQPQAQSEIPVWSVATPAYALDPSIVPPQVPFNG